MLLLVTTATRGLAQDDFTTINDDGEIRLPGQKANKSDSLGRGKKVIPREIGRAHV